jgi:predicted nucleic acid-binding protein
MATPHPAMARCFSVNSPPDPVLATLDPGEREAIQLAHAERADLLLMDEKAGVRIARAQGLAVTGTLGVLVQAAQRNLLAMDVALDRLRATDFRCTPQVYEHARRLSQKKGSKV